jgi:hypothetical protein
MSAKHALGITPVWSLQSINLLYTETSFINQKVTRARSFPDFHMMNFSPINKYNYHQFSHNYDYKWFLIKQKSELISIPIFVANIDLFPSEKQSHLLPAVDHGCIQSTSMTSSAL